MKFEATIRKDQGKGASRRLRHQEQFPAIIYGNKQEAISISLDHNAIINKIKDPSFYDSIILVVDGKEIKVKPKDIQHHPFKPKVIHMDFIRI